MTIPPDPASPSSILIGRGAVLEGQIWNWCGSAAEFADWNLRQESLPYLSGPLPWPVVEILKVFDERGRQHERVLVLCPDPECGFSSRTPMEVGRVFSMSRFDFDDGAGLWELVWGPTVRKLKPEYFVNKLDIESKPDDNVLLFTPRSM